MQAIPVVEDLSSQTKSLSRKRKRAHAKRGISITKHLDPQTDLLQKTLNSMTDALFILDARTPPKILECNEAASFIFGYDKAEMLGRTTDFLHVNRETLKEFQSLLFPAAEKGKLPFQLAEFRMKRKEGSVFPSEHSVMQLLNDKGERTGWVSIVRDITERKKAAEALRRSEEEFRSLMEDTLIGLCNVDLKGTVTFVNKRFEEVSGYSREEVLGKSGFKLGMFDSETLKLFAERMKSKLEGKPTRSFDTRFRCKDGKWIWVEVEGRVIKKWGIPVGFQITSRNMTERKQMEEEIRSLARFPLENPNPILRVGKDGVVLGANPASEALLRSWGIRVGGKAPKTWFDLVSKGFESQSPRSFDTELGDKVYLFTLVPVKDAGYVNVYGRDITDRKRMEDQYRTILGTTLDGFWRADASGHFLDVNDAYSHIIGYSRAELLTMRIQDVEAKESAEETAEHMRRIMATGSDRFETRHRRKDGQVIDVEVSVNWLPGNGGQLFVFLREITERKKMDDELRRHSEHLEELVEERTEKLKSAQETLLRSERLAAIGELAAMVGHDLRNPLTSIANAAYYLKTELSPSVDERAEEMLEVIAKEIEHSNKIVEDLLEYSSKLRLEPRETTPRSIVESAMALGKVPSNIQVTNLTSQEPRIMIDVENIKRVIVNLVRNAVDAMPNGGKVIITSRETKGEVSFSFTDTGTGMTKETMKRMWSPLFTTKPKGMGFGLAICKRIVEAHGGSIFAESTVGEGSTFTVTLPIKPVIGGGGDA